MRKFIAALKTYSKFYSYIKPQVPIIIITAALGFVLSTSIGLLFPWLSRYIIDVLIPTHDIAKFKLVFLGFSFVIIFMAILGILTSFINNRITLGPLAKIQMHMMKQCLGVDMNRDPKFMNIGYLLQLAGDDAGSVINSLMTAVPSLIISAAQFCIYLVVCLSINVKLTLLMLCIVPFHFFIQYLNAKYLREEKKKSQELGIELQSFKTSVFKASSLVKIFGAQSNVLHNNKLKTKTVINQSWKIWRIGNYIGVPATIVGYLHFIFNMYMLYLVIRGQLTLGTYSAFAMYLGSMVGPITAMAGLFNSIIMNSIPMDRLLELKTSMERKTSEKPDSQIKNNSIISSGEIACERLSFSYTPGIKILNNVSFTIPKGRHIAITGPSGSGKSTLARILSGFETRDYDGRIFYDDKSYEYMSLKEVRSRVMLCEQDVKFLPFSIEQNLTFNSADTKYNEYADICKQLGVHRAILSLPQGFETMAFNDYTNMLSGGQMQLLAIARILLKDPDVLVLDEVTSAMDFDTEQRALDVIRTMRKDKTVIYITHRISTIRRFDQIAVMNEGKIEAFDTHTALLQSSKTYNHLFNIGFQESAS